jgi:hypothetical protein
MIMDFYGKIPPSDFRTCIVPSEEYYDGEKLFSGSWKSEASRKIKYQCRECGWNSEWMPDTDEEPPHECKTDEHLT